MKNLSKKAIIAVIVVLVVLGLFYFFKSERPESVVAKQAELTVFGDKGLLYLAFLKDVKDGVKLSVSIGSGTSIARDFYVIPRKNWRNGVPVSGLETFPKKGTELQVILDGKEHKVTLAEVTTETQDLLELDKVTNPEESMKGWGVPAYAAGPATQASRSNVPDLGQRIAECGPTSAANSIISLAEQHGKSLSDLPTPTEIVDGLKFEMDWTPADGVLPDNFVEGKNKWAAKNGLPIRTEKVGDAHGRGTLEKILDTMSRGNAAAELRIKFADANGKFAGGHMVTVTGVRIVGDQTFIDVNDPRTPQGTDTYEVNGNVIEGYPYPGTAIMSWGFIQTWEGTLTGAALDILTDEEVRSIRMFVGQKEKIKVIIVRGKKVPIAQVHVGTGPECKEGAQEIPHYHANKGSVTALDNSVLVDPGGCGYGKVKDIPVEEVEVP